LNEYYEYYQFYHCSADSNIPALLVNIPLCTGYILFALFWPLMNLNHVWKVKSTLKRAHLVYVYLWTL